MKPNFHFILIMLIFARTSSIYAQYDWQDRQKENLSGKIIPYQTDALLPDSVINDTVMGDLPESINEDWLKILESWHVNNFIRPQENCLNEDTNPYFPDSVYIKRMKSLPFLIRMEYNETIRKYIDLYTDRMRERVRYMIGMSYYYFPMIEQKLDRAGLPLELKYLAIVESALNPVAQSRVGAYGLWQFMLPTAKGNGLEVNSLIDERLDPERSTDAACIYFQKLYDMFKDWHLVIAAYNCGEGNVLKAIRRSGGNRDFWQIYSYLPRETRVYLPFYMAAAYVMEYHEEHGLCPIMPDFRISTDTLMVGRNLPFDRIADILKIDKETVKFYNPQYKREIIPGDVRPSILRLPMSDLYAHLESKDSLYASRLDTLMALCQPSVTDSEQTDRRNEKITHTVNTGENVYSIANLYGVTAQNLRKWNGLGRNTKLKKGRKLVIHIDNGGLNYYTASNNKTTTAAPTSVASMASTRTSNSNKTGTNNSGYISYTVKSGDTLSSIASKYKGVTIRKIQSANGMTDTRLKIGQILKIPQV